MNRAALCGIVLGLLAILASACNIAPVKSEPAKALLWELNKPGHKKSFLLGTMHTDEKEIMQSHRFIDESLAQVDTYVMEVVITDAIRQRAQRSMFIGPGEPQLNTMLDKLSWERLVDKMQKRGLSEEQAVFFKPWAAFTILNVPEQDSSEVMDTALQKQSRTKGLQVKGLERISDQIGTLDKLPRDVQLKLLKDYLYFDQADGIFARMKQYYLQRDLDGLLALNDEYMQFTDKQSAELFLDRLIYQRNKRMEQGINKLTKDNACFIAVGALHLPGPQGLLQLLREEGFTLRPIY